MSVTQTDDTSFSTDVLDSSVPVLLDFTATWCGPCKMISPILDAMAADYEGKLKIVKIDVSANPATPAKYGVKNIPALFLIKDGEVVDRRIGNTSRADLDTFVSKVVG